MFSFQVVIMISMCLLLPWKTKFNTSIKALWINWGAKVEIQRATHRSRLRGNCYKWQSMCATVLAGPLTRSASLVPNYISVTSDPSHFSPIETISNHSFIFDLTILPLTIPFYHWLRTIPFHYYLNHFTIY